jgi:DNA-binding LacI/PurR family transcriptional regulator
MDIFQRISVNADAEIPLIVQLTQQLTWLIASGELSPGDRLPPIREMAEALGIHMHTVRLAYQRLEADLLVSIRTRHGTEVLPFDPGNLAEKRQDQPTHLIGVMIPSPGPVYDLYLQGVHQGANNYHCFPLVCYTFDNPVTTERYINQLIAKQVDGFIVTSPYLVSNFDDPALRDKFPPIVFVDAPNVQTNSLLFDSKDAAYRATKHLLGHGYHQIGLLTCPLDWPNVYECYLGYEKALSESGIVPDMDLMVEVPNFQRQCGYDGMREFLQRGKQPQAIFVIADMLALGAMKALQDEGYRIPQDIAITSYNNIEQAALVSPGLTTATIPAFEMGVRAVDMLQKLLTGTEQIQPQITLSTELVIRQSCGCE